jgi:hypothetical protein
MRQLEAIAPKSVPQGLKPAALIAFAARLKPCPFKTSCFSPPCKQGNKTTLAKQRMEFGGCG